MIDGGHTKPVRRPIGGSFLKSLSFIGWPFEAKMEHIVPVLEERLQRRLLANAPLNPSTVTARRPVQRSARIRAWRAQEATMVYRHFECQGVNTLGSTTPPRGG